MNHFRLLSPWALLTILTLPGCGGINVASQVKLPGVDISASVQVGSPIFSSGVVTVSSSVIVNGVNYDRSATSVVMDGHSASANELRSGQIVTLQGALRAGGTSGIADTIVQQTTVVGPVETIDVQHHRLLVMGQLVRIEPDTLVDARLDPLLNSGLQVGTIVAVSGFPTTSGEVRATRIDSASNSSALQVVGKISAVDSINQVLHINRLTVDYRAASLINLQGATLSAGNLVLVRGELDRGIFIARDLSDAADLSASVTADRIVHVQGLVTSVSSGGRFSAGGIEMNVSADTLFRGGTIDDVKPGALVTVDGALARAGSTIEVREIRFDSPAPNATMLSLDNRDFSLITLTGMVTAKISRAADYSVHVTLSEDAADDLAIIEENGRLTVGVTPDDQPTQAIEVAITLPTLDQIKLTGVSDVHLQGFDQPEMSIELSGISNLTGSSLRLSNLTANTSGVTQINLSDSGPLASATVDLSGISQVTLNLERGGMIRGSAKDAAMILYYGSDVNLDVETSPLALLSRLGDTRY